MKIAFGQIEEALNIGNIGKLLIATVGLRTAKQL
jgi:hypothetical protein